MGRLLASPRLVLPGACPHRPGRAVCLDRPDQRYWQCEHCHRNGHPDRACNTFSLDVSMSNTNAAAYTASVLTFSYGQQSKTITVNTRLTSSPVSAGITGTANGVSATGYVTVNPIYVSSVT